MSMSNEMIRQISGALHMRPDEKMLAAEKPNGKPRYSFEQFREFCVSTWEGAPLGDDTAPESAGTLYGAVRSDIRAHGGGRYGQLDAPTEIL